MLTIQAHDLREVDHVGQLVDALIKKTDKVEGVKVVLVTIEHRSVMLRVAVNLLRMSVGTVTGPESLDLVGVLANWPKTHLPLLNNAERALGRHDWLCAGKCGCKRAAPPHIRPLALRPPLLSLTRRQHRGAYPTTRHRSSHGTPTTKRPRETQFGKARW